MSNLDISSSTDATTKNDKINTSFISWEAVGDFLFFLGQRLAQGVLVLLAIIFLTYLGLSMATGAPLQPAAETAVLDTIGYVIRLLQGDLGTSIAATSRILAVPVAEVLPQILSRSLGLLGVSLLFAALVGVILGIISALRNRSGQSLLILLASIIGISAPSFFVALVLQLLLVEWTQFAGRPLLPLGGFGWDTHLILPALVLAARPIAQITRVTALSIEEILGQDYVRTARSKGIRPFPVMFRHVLRNAAVPILTTIGVSLRFSLSSLPVVEFFFGWPGAGFTLLKAISQQDENLSVILLLSLGALFILINLLLETSYRFIDPRLRDLPAQAAREERQTVLDGLRALLQAIRDFVLDNPLVNWQRGRHTPSTPSPFKQILDRQGKELPPAEEIERGQTWRAWRRGALQNAPLLLGGALVLALLAIFLFGPQLAPHSPYTTQGLRIVDGEMSVPPFAPNETHPWGTDVLGRDVMSLILAGTQQTLLLAGLVVTARMALGLILGATAGWLNGTWVDRLILSLAEILAAFPTLLLAMILVLALGIREGLRPFLIALSVIGWGEIMQFVRSQVMAIRPRAFIESAIAAGARTSRILMNHVLPNLLSSLIALVALEMGAVLMLLGELGFIGIFIGGGAFAELDIGGLLYHYSDVPEWGSLLSNIRPYARSYPWTAVYPAMAFFVAILGFNLFGEGMRRLVAIVGVQLTRFFNRYTLLAVLALGFGLNWVQNNTGAVAVYKEQAVEFDGEKALAHVAALTDPALQGRALGSPGRAAAADYIVEQFQAQSLQAAGDEFSFFQHKDRSYQQLTAVPQFSLNIETGPLIYRDDYAEFAGPFRNLGEAAGPIRFFGTGPLTNVGSGFVSRSWPALRYTDFSGQIPLVLSPETALTLRNTPRAGILIVAEDETTVARRQTLSSSSPLYTSFGAGRERGQDTPIFWIDEETADAILAESGQTVADMRRTVGDLEQDEVLDFGIDVNANLSLTGAIESDVPTAHVIGHLPGLNADLDSQMIIVMAQYDAPPLGPTDTFYPYANDNASGVALMLELIRTMRASDYQPAKTFLFVAYSGEGLEGGNPVLPVDVTQFLQSKYGFSNAFEIEAVVDLRGVGGGSGDNLAIAAGGSLRLADLVERAAGQMDVATSRVADPVDMSIVFSDQSLQAGGQEAPQVGIHWAGWEETAATAADTMQIISADTLEQAGEAVALALMIMGRETGY